MKTDNRDKFNLSICFTSKRLKARHSYGDAKPRCFTVFYLDIDPDFDPHWAAEQLTREIGAQLKAHADQILARQKGVVS